MHNEAPLSGLSILLVEDDFYIADDARQTLEDAGATVLGPCAEAAPALALAKSARVDCAMLDVNLGDGPCFELARAMIDMGVPVLLCTGYDARVIPADLRETPRLEKPADKRRLVAALSDLRPR